MLIPIGPVKNVPVTLLRVSHDPPQVLDGLVTHFDGRSYEVTLRPSGDPFQEGEQMLIDFGEGGTGRRRTRVTALGDGSITLELLGRPRRRERREFPRIEGRIDLEYLILDASERSRLESWLRHPHLTDAGDTWVKSDPFMDFSVTGLRFRAPAPVTPGSLMCLRFRIPDLGKQVWNVGGEVVRNETDEGIPALAVAFLGLSTDVSDALMEYTRLCQDRLLGLDSFHEE